MHLLVEAHEEVKVGQLGLVTLLVKSPQASVKENRNLNSKTITHLFYRCCTSWKNKHL